MDAMTFVLFGATGDLAKRKIFPALYNLYLDEKLPHPISIVGLGRKPFTHTGFKEYVEQAILTFSRRETKRVSDTFLNSITYQSLDIYYKDGYAHLLEHVKRREQELGIPQNRLFYLSVAPELFDVISLRIKDSGLGDTAGWKRLIIEKPFGRDLKTARELNEKLSQAFDEDEIYRIDHYLGKPMIQNLESLETANPVIQALWNNHFISNVQITASETVGVEERAGYYDHSGSIRDMFQNHMLQILMMLAMHPPKRLSAEDIRLQKRKIIESLRPVRKEEVKENIVRGQYGPGEIKGEMVQGYRDEPGVAPDSSTDTYLAARLWIDDALWQGVPFYIRTGKRLKAKSTRVVVEFKNPLGDLYEDSLETPAPNLLTININPSEGIDLQINAKNPLKHGQWEQTKIDFTTNMQDVPEAYELLIFDTFRGDATFFAHWNEVELAWKWVQPILEAFEENAVTLHPYPSGSMGPDAADRLLVEQGHHWW